MNDRRRSVVLVTGASRGLGRGIALELAAAGYSVAINYRKNREAAKETAAACVRRAAERTEGNGARFVPFQADIASRKDRERLVEEAIAEFGAIDALVNNAGTAPRVRADIVEAGEDSFEELIRTNVQGPYFLTQAVVRRWLATSGAAGLSTASGGVARKSGSETAFAGDDATPTDGAHSPGAGAPAEHDAPPRSIVFITSISATTASVNRGDYCISKAGLSMAAQLWAARLAAEGIGVYELRPGIMATDMTAGVKEKYDALIAEGLVPQRRWGTPEDVGRAVRTLVDGDFAYSTGSVMYTDGGFHLSRL